MCRNNYECLGIADNMRTVIEVTHFFTNIDKEGMTFLK